MEFSNETLHQLDQEYYLLTFKRFPLAITRGEGSYVWDANGNKYIDTLAGIAVTNVGHCHPKVVEAIREQAGKLLQISNFFVSEPQVMLAKRLSELSRMERVFFTNSGAESLEGAFKIARKYAHHHGRGGKIISFTNSFHGRTLATIATGKHKYQRGFEPIPTGFQQVEFNNIDAVREAVDGHTAGIVIEPVQGEGGINVADKHFMQELRSLCDRENIALIFDEVQCGVGRTGKWFAKEHFGVEPDIMALAKGLGGGVPIGAILANEKLSSTMEFGDHGTTFGGNPLVCAASLATLEVIEQEGLLEAATENGEWLRQQFRDMKDAGITEVRGLGLMVGVEFEFETKPLVMDLIKHGLIANATAEKVLRLVPALNIKKELLNEIVDAVAKSLENIRQHG